MRKNSKIFIGIPTHKGLWLDVFKERLDSTVRELSKYTEQQVDVCLCEGESNSQLARNTLAREFLKSDADYWLAIDDDVVWDTNEGVELFKTIYEEEEGFVVGICPFKGGDGLFPVTIMQDEVTKTPLWKNKENKILQVYGVGLAFAYLHRGVLETIKKSYPELAYSFSYPLQETQHDWFDFFPQGVKNGYWCGQDYAFCRLWQGVGGKIWGYPDMTLRHYRNKDDYREDNFQSLLNRLKEGEFR